MDRLPIKQILFSIIVIISLTFNSCKEKVPSPEDKIIGTWQIKMANIYSVYSFMANGSWSLTERVEGPLNKIIESRGKVNGKWEITESDEEEGFFFLTMTPVSVEIVKIWKINKPVKFKLLSIDEENLRIEMKSGRQITWKRVRSKKKGDEFAEAGVKVKIWPVVVNLKRKREHAKFRFLCIDLDLYLDEPSGSDYISIEKRKNSEEIIYHLHPKIREVVIMYFSSMSYKDVKTLDRVKNRVEGLKVVLNPYFNGRLNEIDVAKVVVTTNTKSVKDFETMYEIESEEDVNVQGNSAENG